MTQLDIVKLFSELLFPVAVTVFLLWERVTVIEKLRALITELQLAIYLLLEKNDLMHEYKGKVDEARQIREKK